MLKKHLPILIMSALLLLLSACATPPPATLAPTSAPAATSTPAAATSAPTSAASAPLADATAQPTAQVTPECMTDWFRPGCVVGAQASSITAQDCALVTRHDMAGFFSGETSQPVQKVDTVNHLIFTQDQTPGLESSCLYYTYNVSAKKTGHSYQITYWVDRPGQATQQQWTNLWATTRAAAVQPVSGLGDDGFFNGGILTFKKGDLYISVQVLRMDANDQVTPADQLASEKLVAEKALGRLN